MEMDGSEKQRRVFVVCVDGGTFDLIRPWVREGHLPCFQRLMREGVWAELSAEIPPITVNNILSMVTGKNAGKHGTTHWLKKGDRYGPLEVGRFECLRKPNPLGYIRQTWEEGGRPQPAPHLSTQRNQRNHGDGPVDANFCPEHYLPATFKGGD